MSLSGGAYAAGFPSSAKSASPGKGAPLAESVTQDIRIEDKFVLGTAKIRWQAEKGDVLPLLFEPTVLMGLDYPTNSLELVQAPAGSRAAQQLLARKKGVFDIKVQYELPVTSKNPESGFALPVPYGLVNRLNLTVVNLDVDVLSPQAVSIQRDTVGSNTVATLVLSPASDAWVGWKPRSRDVKREKPVFYAELSQLYVPAAGVIEGAHYVAIRPAQGELGELILDVPAGTTITDVIGSGSPTAAGAQAGASVSVVSLWRFDPDTRKLRVTLNPAQSRPFSLLVRSQVATGPLPFEHRSGWWPSTTPRGKSACWASPPATKSSSNASALNPSRRSTWRISRRTGLRAPAADSRADAAPRLPLCRHEGHRFPEGLSRRARYPGRDPGHPFARRGPHRAGRQRHGRHHARGHIPPELRHAGGLRRRVHQRLGAEPLDRAEERRRAGDHAAPGRQDRRPAAVRHQPGRAGSQGHQRLGRPATGPARGEQTAGHPPAGAGARHAPPGRRPAKASRNWTRRSRASGKRACWRSASFRRLGTCRSASSRWTRGYRSPACSMPPSTKPW